MKGLLFIVKKVITFHNLVASKWLKPKQKLNKGHAYVVASVSVPRMTISELLTHL